MKKGVIGRGIAVIIFSLVATLLFLFIPIGLPAGSPTGLNTARTVSFAPTTDQAILNSTSGTGALTNTSTDSENLTVIIINSTDADFDQVQNITDWRINGTYYSQLNLPFESNISNTSAGAVKDYSTSNNNATLGNGTSEFAPTWTGFGIAGGAYTFDGINDYITLQNQPNLSSGFTYSAWIKRLNDSVPQSSFFNNNQFFIRGQPEPEDASNPFEAFVALSDGSVEPRANSAVPAAVGQWYFLAVTWDKTTLRIYVNGTLTDSETRAGNLTATTLEPNIGRGIQTTIDGTYFGGVMDEVQFHTKALSAEQIAQMYADGLAGRHVESIVSQELNPGDIWSAAVTPNDNQPNTDGTTVTSNNVTIFHTPANVSACGAVIDTPGNYTVLNNLTANATTGNPCIRISAGNVLLNGQGHRINGSSNLTVAVNITGVNNVTIYNLTADVAGTANATGYAIAQSSNITLNATNVHNQQPAENPTGYYTNEIAEVLITASDINFDHSTGSCKAIDTRESDELHLTNAALLLGALCTGEAINAKESSDIDTNTITIENKGTGPAVKLDSTSIFQITSTTITLPTQGAYTVTSITPGGVFELQGTANKFQNTRGSLTLPNGTTLSGSVTNLQISITHNLEKFDTNQITLPVTGTISFEFKGLVIGAAYDREFYRVNPTTLVPIISIGAATESPPNSGTFTITVPTTTFPALTLNAISTTATIEPLENIQILPQFTIQNTGATNHQLIQLPLGAMLLPGSGSFLGYRVFMPLLLRSVPILDPFAGRSTSENIIFDTNPLSGNLILQTANLASGPVGGLIQQAAFADAVLANLRGGLVISSTVEFSGNNISSLVCNREGSITLNETINVSIVAIRVLNTTLQPYVPYNWTYSNSSGLFTAGNFTNISTSVYFNDTNATENKSNCIFTKPSGNGALNITIGNVTISNNVTNANERLIYTFIVIGGTFVPDTDNDATADTQDNCPSTANPSQTDSDSDGIGDACDTTPFPPSRGGGGGAKSSAINQAETTPITQAPTNQIAQTAKQAALATDAQQIEQPVTKTPPAQQIIYQYEPPITRTAQLRTQNSNSAKTVLASVLILAVIIFIIRSKQHKKTPPAPTPPAVPAISLKRNPKKTRRKSKRRNR